ncbi:MAG: transporter substrate-binding domain-containing protein [Bermanella sp.]
MSYQILLTLVVCLSLSWSIFAKPILIFGDDSYPPYSYFEGGVQKGIYTDIIHRVDERLVSYEITIQAMPWKRALRKVKNGEIALFYPPYKRPKERPYMDYSVEILPETLSIFCRKELGLTRESRFPQDYKGLMLGENLGFSSGESIQEARDKGVLSLSSARGTRANLIKIIDKKLDCYVNDRLSILYELNVLMALGEYDGLSLVETVKVSSEYGYLGVSQYSDVYPGITDFIKQFNQQIKVMKNNGEINKIVNKYLKRIKIK